jgi:hypothetical protein
MFGETGLVGRQTGSDFMRSLRLTNSPLRSPLGGIIQKLERGVHQAARS